MRFGLSVKGIVNFAVWLIVAAVCVNPLLTHALAQMGPVSQRPAGCHEHGKAPAPVSYQCCQAGHDVALVKASVVEQSMAERSASVVVSSSVVLVESSVVNLPEISGGPPGSSPLRI